jgi:hypothetical protein
MSGVSGADAPGVADASPESPFREYWPDTVGTDGYPFAWHETLKHLVREEAGHRCVRCRHPYRRETAFLGGKWSQCDDQCEHGGPTGDPKDDGTIWAEWRILTVHHLDGIKTNCRWWNLVALCQRCHLTIQGRVNMSRVYPWPHSEWFKPYVAGYYALVYLDEELTRPETEARMDELLELELATPGGPAAPKPKGTHV